jgi:mRNA interferase MazF
VIIVSRDAINQNSSVVICVPVTDLANCKRIYPSQVMLKKGTGGLSKDSVVLCEQIRAITSDRLVSRLGELDRQSIRAVDDVLRIALDLG